MILQSVASVPPEGQLFTLCVLPQIPRGEPKLPLSSIMPSHRVPVTRSALASYLLVLLCGGTASVTLKLESLASEFHNIRHQLIP